ncbi:sensor histidine kinase [Blastomonas sp.]|uniref:sensor histidine kinase n=1 Tax=Blastomonas sp. TaxID=1909299 RepID=UPI002613536D|nr:histidine kinase [Blastomonas sp.]MDM7954947.1 histidine kinase [Blastomonas sp.]
MAMLPFKPTPFFANKNRAFWNLQTLGWAGALALRGISGLANGQPISFLVPIIIATITGYSISLVMGVIYQTLIDRKPLVTWGITLIVLLTGSALFAFVDAWVATLYRPGSVSNFTAILLGAFYLDLTLLGAWSALYYAINFFLRIEEQQDQMLRLENQATSAQLAMLRYQLNPHFLFNTLNSISTLVLLKQTEPANAMLSRLSSFLRYTLANEPTARVTLAQEVETLKLYLDIEKMRFEERLRAHFDIEPNAAFALLPSLLLQPLVENAIKYAVTPKEDGADITISAQLIGPLLRITVTDTGPGLKKQGTTANASTGVGLANIRDRLSQAYDNNHRFETRSSPGGGYSVIIEIPFETREQRQLQA